MCYSLQLGSVVAFLRQAFQLEGAIENCKMRQQILWIGQSAVTLSKLFVDPNTCMLDEKAVTVPNLVKTEMY